MSQRSHASVQNIWIKSILPDCVFLIGSGFIGLLFGYIAPRLGIAMTGSFVIYFFLGLTHFGATWFFYVDATNRNYFKARSWIFYYIPLLLILLPVALAVSKLSVLILAITYWFSGYHVTKQSVGVTSLYRSRLGIFDAKDRKIDMSVIMSASFLALFGRNFLYKDFGYEFIVTMPYGKIFIGVLGMVFIYSFIRWMIVMIQRFRNHGLMALPLFLFTIVSIVLFTPFLYVKDFQVAFMSNLLGHYTQYLVLTWSINRNKYGPKNKEQATVPILSYLSRSFPLYFMALIIYAAVVFLAGQISVLLPVVGLTWAHFYVDGYLFKFKDPNMRKMILPYIV